MKKINFHSWILKGNINNTNDDEKYFAYSLIYSIIIEDLNEALKVNLNLSDILFTSFLKINKIYYRANFINK